MGISIGDTHAPRTNWSEGENCSHVVQFYADDTFLERSLAELISTALNAGDSAVAIATEAHRIGLAERLVELGLNVVALREQGRYTAVDASATLNEFMVGELPDPERFATIGGGLIDRASAAGSQSRRVVAFGEMVALLWQRGNREGAIRLEALWNDLAKTRLFALRCAYPMSGFGRQEDAEQFRQVCATHTAVIPEESYAELATEGERLQNISQLQQRTRALESETAKGSVMAREIETRKHAQAELAEFSGQLMRTQDDERHHVARQLHEAISQDLVALQIGLQMMEKEGSALRRVNFMRDARDTVARCIRELRSLTYILHPPLLDDVGLASAISWYAGCFSERNGIRVTLDLPATNLRLATRIELTLFRILQEALMNFENHSETTSVAVRLQVDAAEAVLEVTVPSTRVAGAEVAGDDNGSHLNPLVLMGIRQRLSELGGRLEVEASASGTHLRAVTPITLLN